MNDITESRLAAIERRLQVIEDREAIIKLKGTYVNYNDGGWKGPTHQFPDEVAELFTEDGIWDGRPDTGYAEGRDQIRKLFNEFQIMPFIIHYVTNPVIEIDGDSGKGHWHAIVTANMPDGTARWILGYYIETYQRTADGWKFKTLRFEAGVNRPYSEGWGKLPE
jgi:ketosteroid isomerase-like protein